MVRLFCQSRSSDGRPALPGIGLCHLAEATAAAFAREITKKPREAAFFK
jgi:hypothetical protein